jgi:hypothetical protein
MASGRRATRREEETGVRMSIGRTLVLGVAMAVMACGSSDGSTDGSTNGGTSNADPGGTAGTSSDALQHCVDGINSYRAKVSATPYTRSSALETFAAAGAQSDSQSGQAHGHFIATSGGGVAFAENELPGWPLAQYKSMSDLIDQGLAAMWSEGPGGGHYDNMSSSKYTSAGCGTYTLPNGDVWVTMDFK